MASNAEKAPIWWRHHAVAYSRVMTLWMSSKLLFCFSLNLESMSYEVYLQQYRFTWNEIWPWGGLSVSILIKCICATACSCFLSESYVDCRAKPLISISKAKYGAVISRRVFCKKRRAIYETSLIYYHCQEANLGKHMFSVVTKGALMVQVVQYIRIQQWPSAVSVFARGGTWGANIKTLWYSARHFATKELTFLSITVGCAI